MYPISAPTGASTPRTKYQGRVCPMNSTYEATSCRGPEARTANEQPRALRWTASLNMPGRGGEEPNPIIKRWAACCRTVVSTKTFKSLDSYKWANPSHPKKPTSWRVARYFGRFNSTKRD